MRFPLLLSAVLSAAIVLVALAANKQLSDLSPANNSTEENYCGSNLAWQSLLDKDPTLLPQQEALEDEYYAAQQTASTLKTTAPPYTIPVVFHIVHEGGVENVPESAIQTTLDFLNESFANTGPYDPATGVPTDIDFCLAKRKPDGSISTGIERINDPLTNMDMNQDLDLKNLSRYDPTQYLNVWVVNEICAGFGCGVAGYAYFPSAHGGNLDGIVVEARWLGNSPGNSAVMTHEVGHYLGLYHTFEGGCQNDDCLANGDRVCDTPPDQSTAAVPCNASPNSCSTDTDSGLPTDQPDQFQNYMDYGDWDCYSIFTAGQRDRMHFFLEGTRGSLLTSQGCLDPCTSPLSVSITNDFSESVDQGATVNLTASGSNADNYTWYLDGVEIGTGNPFPYVFATEGSYTVSVQASNSDPNCLADAEATVLVRCPVLASFEPTSFAVTPGTVVFFTNASIDATTYEWLVDGNSEATTNGFFYQFDNLGTYTVRLEASDGNCSDDYAVVITVGTEGSSQTGIPIWPMQGGTDGGFHTVDWRTTPPLLSNLGTISDQAGGATGAAFNGCGAVVFYAVHTAQSATNQLYIFGPDGSPLLDATTPNAPGLNAVQGGELQVIPVPSTSNEWYLIYRQYANGTGAPANNEAYLALQLRYSRVKMEADGQLTVMVRDQLLNANGISYTYSDGLAVSRTVNGDADRNYLYAGRRAVNQASISLDRFVITSTGISWQDNTGNMPASYWSLTHAGSFVELSPTEDRVVVGNRNQFSNFVDFLIVNTATFNAASAVSLVGDNLTLVADGQAQDESSVLPVNQTVSSLGNNAAYPLRFMRNFKKKLSGVEFSPNGRFLYLTSGGYVSAGNTNLTYLAQVDLESSPLEVRVQIQDTPTPYSTTTGVGCPFNSCGDDWNSIGQVESSYNGNLYFVKRNLSTLFVIPNPNNFMPQNLVPGEVDLATADEPNINLLGLPGAVIDQIDGYNYLSGQTQTVDVVAFGLNCAGECRAPFELQITSDDNSFQEIFTVSACPTVIPLCVDTNLVYRITDLELGIEYPNAIVNGEINAPLGSERFEFSEPQGCPEDCDEPYVFFYGEDADYSGRTLLAHEEFLFIGGQRNNEALLTKLTTAGEVVWTQTMRPINNLPNVIIDLKIDSEGMIIGAGSARSGTNIGSFAFKMNPDNGAAVWTRTYTDPASDYFNVTDIHESPTNGDYIMLGTSFNASNGLGCDAAFYSINRNDGDIAGQRIHYHLGSCEGIESSLIFGNNFYVTGRYNFSGGGFNRMRPAISSFNSTGTPLYSRLYLVNVNQDARLYSSDISLDGPNNLAILAHGDDNGIAADNNDLWIIRTNLIIGGAQLVRKYTLPEPVNGKELMTVGNGYVLLAQARNSNRLFLLRINGAGNLIWAKQLDDLTTSGAGDEMILAADGYVYLTAEHTANANRQLALLRIDLETGEFPSECITNQEVDVVMTPILNPYDGFNSLSPYNTQVDGSNGFDLTPGLLDPLPISCAPSCEEICDNGTDDDGDGLADCEDPDCDCEEDCPDQNYVSVFGDENTDEEGFSLVALPNGNILLGAGGPNYFSLMEVSPQGTLVQENRFSIPNKGTVTDLILDSDGMITGAGHSGTNNQNLQSITFRYDHANQAMLWMNISPMGRNSNSILEPVTGGDFLFVGSRLSAPSPGFGDDISWLSLDRNTGNPTTNISANFNLGGPESFYQTIAHNNKIYTTGRFSTSSTPNSFRTSVSRLGLDGQEEWSRLLHISTASNARLYGFDIDIYQNELYIISSGDDDGTSLTDTQIFLYKMSTEGALLWTRKYDLAGFNNEFAQEMIVLPDGLLIYGSELGTGSDLFLFKVDFSGEVLWAKRFLGDAPELVGVYPTNNLLIREGGSIYFTGITQSFGTTNSKDVLLVRATLDGEVNSDCYPSEEITITASTIGNAVVTPTNLSSYPNSLNFVSTLLPASETVSPTLLECLTACEEICDNGIDDDGDGLIDCEDPDLANDCCCYVPPVLELGEDIVVCENGVIVLDAGPGFTSYLWSDLTTEQTLTTTFPGEYSVTVTDQCGTTQSDTILITVDPATEIDLGPDVTLCPGETLTLSVDGFVTYEWFPATGFDCNTCPTVVFTASGDTEIIVVATSATGCISTDTLQVTLGDTQSGSFTTAGLCPGDMLTFGTQIISEPGIYLDTLNTGGCLTVDTLQVTPLETFTTSEDRSICAGQSTVIFGNEETAAGTYSMTFTAQNGCDSTHTVNLMVEDAIVTNEDRSICAGQSTIIFGNEETQAGTYTMAFTTPAGCDSTHTVNLMLIDEVNTSEDRSICAGETTDIFGTPTGTAGQYSMTFMGQNGCDSTHTINLGLLETFATSEDRSICAGATTPIFGNEESEAGTYSMTFMAQNGCDSTHTIVLSLLETFATSETVSICAGDVIDIFGQPETEAGDYSMTFLAQNGCDSTHTVTLSLLDNQSTEEDRTVCTGETTDIFGTPTGTAGEYSMTFTGENGCDSTHTITLAVLDTFATNASLSLCAGDATTIFGQVVTEAGDYSMTFTAQNGCDSTHTVSVSVLPTFSTSATASICPGDSTDVFGQNIGTAGEYSMTFTAVNGCDSVHTITVLPLQDFSTSETIADLCQGDSLFIFGDTITQSGVYAETFTAVNGCDSVHTVTAEFLPTSTTMEEVFICEGESITIFGELVSEPGIYQATYTSSNGCDSTSVITLTEETFSGSAYIFSPCPSDPEAWIVYISTHGNGGPYHIVWNGQVAVSNTLNAVPEGDHIAQVTSANGCMYEVEFTVRPFGQPWWGLVSDPTCNDPQGGQIRIEVNPISDDTLTYSLDGINFSDTPLFDGLNPGDYTLYVKYGSRCVITENLNVPEPAEFSLTLPEDRTIKWGESLPIVPTTDVMPGATYEWTPATGLDCPTCDKVIAQPEETTRYTLKITDLNGCTQVDDILVKVDRRIPYYVPNAFSPNGDSFNEYFTIYSANDGVQEVLRMSLFDRWGGEVFTRTNFPPNREEMGWNGRYREQPAATGVYVYYLELKLGTGEVVMVKGDVVLIR